MLALYKSVRKNVLFFEFSVKFFRTLTIYTEMVQNRIDNSFRSLSVTVWIGSLAHACIQGSVCKQSFGPFIHRLLFRSYQSPAFRLQSLPGVLLYRAARAQAHQTKALLPANRLNRSKSSEYADKNYANPPRPVDQSSLNTGMIPQDLVSRLLTAGLGCTGYTMAISSNSSAIRLTAGKFDGEARLEIHGDELSSESSRLPCGPIQYRMCVVLLYSILKHICYRVACDIYT